MRSWILAVGVLLLGTEVRSEEPVPWKTNRPIAAVKKELFQKHPKPRTAALVTLQYVGPKFELMEWHGYETNDDVWDNNRVRWSLDNGKTWSPFVDRDASTNKTYVGQTVWEGGIAREHDPASGRLVEAWLRQINVGGRYHCFTYTRTSADLGHTWSEPEQLRYEAGEPFDPKQPLKPAFLKANHAYCGNNILRHTNGTLIHTAGHANAKADPENESRAWRMGALCFIGHWNGKSGQYEWAAGVRTEVSPDLSSRGLMESETAELKEGRVLIVWRGSSTAKTPGRKFYSVSSDGGRTLSPIREWKYDDGSSFYSPSSYHRMIRHSQTGKLYWLGNISPTAPAGNSPRYPLVIAEVEESMPALKKKTVTVIDDRSADQGPAVQFSNFSLLEDRETRELVLQLTTYGQDANPANWASADSYRYRLSLTR